MIAKITSKRPVRILDDLGAMRASATIALIVGLTGTACSSGSEGTGASASASSLTGAWCGIEVSSPEACVGDEVFYVELVEETGSVIGSSCEAYQKECYAVVDGSLVGAELTYAYEFSGYRVTMTLSLDAEGQMMTGSAHSTKCGCNVPITLHRI